MGSFARIPDNPLTRLMGGVGAANAAAGKPAGRSYSPSVITVDDLPSVRSASMGPVAEVELTEEEVAERERKLSLLGPQPDDEDEGRATQSFDPGALRSALAPYQPKTFEVSARNTFMPGPLVSGRMMDFTKITHIDMTRRVVVIDGMDLPMTDDEVRDLQQWAINKAVEHVSAQLAAAALALGLVVTKETSGTEEVLDVPADQGATGVHNEQLALPVMLTDERSAADSGGTTESL